MESEGDESSVGGDESFGDDDSTSDDDQEEQDPEEIYQDALRTLREGGTHIDVDFLESDVLQLVLKNVDEYVEALRAVTPGVVRHVMFGSVGAFQYEEKICITSQTSSAWNKLFEALATLTGATALYLGGCNLSAKLMVALIRSMPTVPAIRLWLPWLSLRDSIDMLIQPLAEHSCTDIWVRFAHEDFETVEERKEVAPDGVVFNHLDDAMAASKMLLLDGVSIVDFFYIPFSLDDCISLGRLLVSGFNASNRIVFTLYECTFPNGGCNHIARGLRDTHAIRDLCLTNMFDQKDLRDSFISSLPFNTSMENISLYLYGPDVPFSVNASMFELAKSIMLHNKSLKSLIVEAETRRERPINTEIPADYREELELAMQQNYTLERVEYFKWKPNRIVQKLNKAGRRYLSEGHASSKSKCIAVLAKVKGDIGALYFHLRENNVLFAEASKSGDRNEESSPVVLGKRKAGENVCAGKPKK